MLLMIGLVIVFLVALNALYVGAEFAVISVRKTQVSQLAADNNKNALALLPILEDGERLDRYVATCQVGITVSSLVLGAFTETALAHRVAPLILMIGDFDPQMALTIAVGVILIFLTALQMVVGELVPKSLALQYPTQTALFTFIPMRWSMLLLNGFISALNVSATLLLKLFGFKGSVHRHVHTSEELAMLLQQSREGGALEPDEHARLHRALNLDVWSAAELMVPRRNIHAIDRNTPVAKILEQVAKSPYTRLPVYEGSIDNVSNILHTKDLVAELAIHGDIQRIDHLLRPLEAVPEIMKADQLLAKMRRRRVHMVSVINEYGTFVGIVTIEDILSELVGEVGDEFKAGQLMPEVLPDGRIRLPGMMRPDEARRWIGKLWVSDSNTLSGLVTETLRSLPAPGDKIIIQGLEVEVELVKDRMIRSVIVKPVHDNKVSEV